MTYLIKTFQFRHQKCWLEDLINPRHLHTPTSTSNTQTHVRNLHIIKIKPTHDIQTNQMNQCKSKQRTLNIKEHNLQYDYMYYLKNLNKFLYNYEVFGVSQATHNWSYNWAYIFFLTASACAVLKCLEILKQQTVGHTFVDYKTLWSVLGLHQFVAIIYLTVRMFSS